jgi:hypothetical protein
VANSPNTVVTTIRDTQGRSSLNTTDHQERHRTVTDSDTERNDILARFHQLLLRIAGQLPDDLVTTARQWIASDRLADAAESVAFTAALDEVWLTEDDLVLLAEVLSAADRPTQSIDEIPLEDKGSRTFTFTSEAAEPGAGGAARQDEALTEAVLGVVAGTNARGIWRAWRTPGSPEASSARDQAATVVWLIEMGPETPGHELPLITARAQDALLAAGAEQPQVEVYAGGAPPPPYQALARAAGVVVWAAAPEPHLSIARVFDSFDPLNGPAFDPDHALLPFDAEEHQLVLDYLTNGLPLLITTALERDILAPDQEPAVPMTFRTDGRWIWTDAVPYYLLTHEMAPDADLLAHIRENEYRMPFVDGVAQERAMAVLTSPSADA